MLEGLLEVYIAKKVVEQTTSVCQSNHSTLPTLLGQQALEHTCMELNMRLEAMLMDLFTQSLSTMSRVQCATLQHDKLL